MKHLLLILSFLLLSSPVIGQETGVLFLREVNDNWGWFEDGNKDKDAKYIGEFKDGFFEDRQPNGQGTITYPNGRKYVGEWKDGLPNGQGTYTFPDGRMYVGQYKDGEFHGQGTLTSPSGYKYEGEWKDGRPNGRGTEIFPDGSKGIGEFRDGRPWNSTHMDKKGKMMWGKKKKQGGAFAMIEAQGKLFLYNKKTGDVWMCNAFKKICEQLTVENKDID